jgi:energy coupling factor transporter S component ThiW
MKNVNRLALMGVLIALGVVASYTSALPLFGAKLFPAQAAINVVAGAVIGPWYGAVVALGISLIRIGLGTGTPLSIPGSLFGVVLAGLLYRYTRSKVASMAGEMVGTGIIGAVAAYPVAVFLLGNAKAASASMAYFIIPFASSSVAGAILGGVVLTVLERFTAIRPATR